MALANFNMLINEFFNKDPGIVPEEYPLIILDSKSAMCMDNDCMDTKHTRYMARGMIFLRNGEK